MLRKSKRIICIVCVLICIFPVVSYSIDKEEFLKFLIDSSYPESSNQTDDSTNKDNEEAEKTVNNEDDYIKFHIGEENIPTLNSNDEKEEVSVASSEYKNNIRLTKDNKWVLVHNDDIDKRFCENGLVKDLTFDEIRSYTYKNGSNFWKLRDVKVPTLDEFLDVFVGSNTRPQIEIKADTYDLLYTVIDAVVAKGLEKSAIIISFDLEQLRRIHEINPNIELWYLIGRITQEEIDKAKAIGNNVWLSPHFDKNDKESIQLAVDNKIGVSFWTVNTIKDAKMLYEIGVRYYETDILCN